MADFNELLSTARNPGDDGAPETIYDDLAAAYNDRVAAAEAKISQLTEAKNAADGELTRVRLHNYELLTSTPMGNPSTPTTGAQEDDEPGITLDDIISYG